MASNLEHEDLLIKLRAKLNEEEIKLWEAPYISCGENHESTALQELSSKYAAALNIDESTVLAGLTELQKHSIDRVKANEEFKETGYATFRIKISVKGESPKLIKITKKLSILGEELINSVAEDIKADIERIKLIYNGKVLKTNQSLKEQGVQNGAQMMALVMVESPEQAKKKDDMYMVMKMTLDDATLLSEEVNHWDGDDYMKIEDQSGKAVSLPPGEKRSLMIGLAVHEHGRTAAASRQYSLALVLFLEADRLFSECRSSILNSVDNWAVLQLDISWCYLCLQNLSSAGDVAARLSKADAAFKATYGEDLQRVIALKGNAANERVLFARLYLLQGIVAYHQNKRAEAKVLLEKAERELSCLRVNEDSVHHLMELGWSAAQARWGLRAAGSCDLAHDCLLEMRKRRQLAREKHRQEREQRALGVCADGSLVRISAVQSLVAMGFKKSLALIALKSANNNVTDAIRLIQDHPELLDSDVNEVSDASSDESNEPDQKLLTELVSMGYRYDLVRKALRVSRNDASAAVDRLVEWSVGLGQCDPNKPSTSSEDSRKRQKNEEKNKKKKDREMALSRLKKSIYKDEDEYLGGALSEEEQFLVQYKSLI